MPANTWYVRRTFPPQMSEVNERPPLPRSNNLLSANQHPEQPISSLLSRWVAR